MKKNIVWLASYPKSGNTWFRIFLSNLRNLDKAPVDINKIDSARIFSAIDIFEETTGIELEGLLHDEIDILRSDTFRYASQELDDVVFVKIHDALIKTTIENYIIPLDATFGAIYMIRNPLDVAVSYMFHLVVDMAYADQKINHPITLCGNKGFNKQLRQQLLSWKEHLHVVRYIQR